MYCPLESKLPFVPAIQQSFPGKHGIDIVFCMRWWEFDIEEIRWPLTPTEQTQK